MKFSRIFFVFIFTAIGIYLIPGLTNTKAANLKLISGFPPPLWYSVYHRSSDCLFNLDCYKDYEEGLMVARRDNKPILLDFTGYACTNCRKMEESVWNNPDVLMLMHRFVVISLYVDDKKNLPLKEQFVYTFPGSNEQKSIKTYGDKWATFQTENFHNNSQPLYALINLKEELMNQPAPYTPSVKEYADWLKCGLQTFNKK